MRVIPGELAAAVKIFHTAASLKEISEVIMRVSVSITTTNGLHKAATSRTTATATTNIKLANQKLKNKITFGF